MKFCALVLMHAGREHTEVKLLCGYQDDARNVHLNDFNTTLGAVITNRRFLFMMC